MGINAGRQAIDQSLFTYVFLVYVSYYVFEFFYYLRTSLFPSERGRRHSLVCCGDEVIKSKTPGAAQQVLGYWLCATGCGAPGVAQLALHNWLWRKWLGDSDAELLSVTLVATNCGFTVPVPVCKSRRWYIISQRSSSVPVVGEQAFELLLDGYCHGGIFYI